MLKLVVFDCDGVMISSKEANRAYYNHLLQAFSRSPMDDDEIQYVHVQNVIESVRHIFRHYPEISLDDVHSFRATLDYANFLPYMQMEPDLPEFLRLIKPKYHTAISTNRSDTMGMVLDTFNLRPWFDMVVTALDVSRPKPAPEGMIKIMDRFQVKPEEVIYIGDSTVDQDLCLAVDVDLIAFRNPSLKARYHVDDFMTISSLPPFQEA